MRKHIHLIGICGTAMASTQNLTLPLGIPPLSIPHNPTTQPCTT